MLIFRSFLFIKLSVDNGLIRFLVSIDKKDSFLDHKVCKCFLFYDYNENKFDYFSVMVSSTQLDKSLIDVKILLVRSDLSHLLPDILF